MRKFILILVLLILMFSVVVWAQGRGAQIGPGEDFSGESTGSTTSSPQPPPSTPQTTQPYVPPDVFPSMLPGKWTNYQVGKKKEIGGYTMYNYDTKTARPQGYTYYNHKSENVARVSPNGYERWENGAWVETNYDGMKAAVTKSQKDFVNSDKVPADQRAAMEKEAEKNSKKAVSDLENQAISRGYVSPCATGDAGWRCIGVMFRAYDKYKGIGQATAMFFPSYQKWTQDVRKTISQTFCGFVSIQNCFESLICGAVLDISAGDSISGNVLFGRGPNGQPLAAGTLSAERSLPIILKGLEREQLRDILGHDAELVVINGNVINISEVDTTTLPATEIRLYKIQYSLTNINDRQMEYNLEFKGQTTRKLFAKDQKLTVGQTVSKDDSNIEVYSGTKYDEVCMTFDPSLPSGGSSTGSLMVAPKMVNKLCKPIAEYSGGATSLGNYAKKEQDKKQSGAPSGGFI